MSGTPSSGVFGAFRSWVSVPGGGVVGGAAIGIVLAAVAVFWWRGQTIAKLEDEAVALRDDLARTEERAGANAAALLESERWRVRAERAVGMRDREAEALAGEIGALQRKLREAAKHEQQLDGVVTGDIADALCVQYAAASGYAVRNGGANAAGIADAGTGHTAAGRHYVAALDCAAWRKLTYRDLIEWAGELQRHAGLERADKAGARAWAGAGDGAKAEDRTKAEDEPQ